MKEQELRDRFEADVKDWDINLSKSNGAYVSSETNLIWFGYKTAAAPLLERIETLEELLEQIKQWSLAYPVEIFTEPDLKKAHELLQAGGMTLDSISASNMRYILNQVVCRIDTALQHKEQT